MSEFKKQLKDYYNSQKLSESQLSRLRQKSGNPLFRPAFVAVVIIALITFFLYPSADLQTRINEEIAYNHNKNLNVEIETANLPEIQQHLAKLDFQIASSEKLPLDNWEIMGARYCKVQGRLAAQIKVKNLATGASYTLYQVPYPEGLASIENDSFIDGTRVQTWKEKGLLMGLAGPAN